MPFLPRLSPRVLRAGLAVVAVVAGFVVVTRGPGDKTAVAYFTRTVHVYAGSDVQVLGVKIGSVRSVTPDGDTVRVVLAYDGRRRIPADAFAVVLAPTLVADRVVQLTPPYTGGPVLPDGAEIPVRRTEIPVELDEFDANLARLVQALGPAGANKDGALSRLLEVGAINLRGQGAKAHTTVTQVARLVGALGDNRDALFATIRNLQAFTSTLATHDTETRSFTDELAAVSAQLDAERNQFAQVLSNLGVALGDVTTFVKDNKQALSDNVAALARVTDVLAKQKVLLSRLLDMGAVGVGNYPHMYTPQARTYNARFAGNAWTDNPALFTCQLYDSVGGSPQECLKLLAPLENLPVPPPNGGGGP